MGWGLHGIGGCLRILEALLFALVDLTERVESCRQVVIEWRSVKVSEVVVDFARMDDRVFRDGLKGAVRSVLQLSPGEVQLLADCWGHHYVLVV